MKEKDRIKIEQLVAYYETRRNVGHSIAIVEGASNHRVIVLGATSHQARQIAGRCASGSIPVSWQSDLDAIRGLDLPMVIDNAAMIDILRSALNIIRDLERQVIELTQRQVYNKLNPEEDVKDERD